MASNDPYSGSGKGASGKMPKGKGNSSRYGRGGSSGSKSHASSGNGPKSSYPPPKNKHTKRGVVGIAKKGYGAACCQ
jgi:hypothetical protein|tara:strand:- start:8839 stop:9069 length:231 start_codon:yes stop_codon:yes gene_type:complete